MPVILPILVLCWLCAFAMGAKLRRHDGKFGLKQGAKRPLHDISMPKSVVKDVKKTIHEAAGRWCDSTFAKQFLGNTLSMYWGARTFAIFAGLPFNFDCPDKGGGGHAWINQLPASGEAAATGAAGRKGPVTPMWY